MRSRTFFRFTLAVIFLIGLSSTDAIARGPSEAASPDRDEPALTARPADTIRAMLDAAIDDERHALAFYAAVIEKHGDRRPFSNIINAERRHEAALLAQYERLSLTPPENRWVSHAFAVPGTLAEACDAAEVAEVRNGAIYDDLIARCDDEMIVGVFTRLRWASIERHLPAFRRHGSGWQQIDPDTLTDRQRSRRATADRARTEMFGSLFAALSHAIAEGGPADAIGVCAERAPEIAADIGAAHGVRIGRTAGRLRNPANSPPVWADLILDDEPNQPVLLADRAGRLGTLTPIRLASACLQCHGSEDDIAPTTRRALDARYPDDHATGYAENDLRGWFWVEVPASTITGNEQGTD